MRAHLETPKNMELSGLGGKRKRRNKEGVGEDQDMAQGRTR
jgi:hypothetical protein